MVSLYQILKASKIDDLAAADDMYTALFSRNSAAEHELQGVPPLNFRSNGQPLIEYAIYGNMQQSGTPTPTSPIYPSECGERTAQLYNSADTSWIFGILDDNGRNTGATTSHYTGNFTEVNANKSYVIGGTIGTGRNQHRIYFYDAEKRWISRTPAKGITENSFTTPANCKYLQRQVVVAVENTTDWILNEGATVKPYEPYGYKLPITLGTNTYPV